jgi:hypothetical protein
MTIDAAGGVRNTSNMLPTGDQALLDFGGDVGASVAAMMLLHARETREGTSEARAAEERNIEAQEARQVQAMHDQADQIRAAGLWEGTSNIVAGVLGVGAGAVTLNGETLRSGELVTSAQGRVEYLNGSAKVVVGSGNVFAAIDKADAQNAEADGVAAGNRSEAAKRRLADLNDAAKDAQELTRTAIDFYRDATRTKADTDRAAVSMRV